MDDDVPVPEPSKLTLSKERWAREGRQPARARLADAARLPPGQHRTTDWPVLDLGEHPDIVPGAWQLQLFGAIARPSIWRWTDLMAQPQANSVSDIHCVTSWSRYDNQWQGVSTIDLLESVVPLPATRFVLLHSSDGYTTNLTLEDFAAEGAMLVHAWSGQPLAREHGGPVRLVIPHLYFWKSAKWINKIEFRTQDAPGFWEVRGYHNRGDPWLEQRYSNDE